MNGRNARGPVIVAAGVVKCLIHCARKESLIWHPWTEVLTSGWFVRVNLFDKRFCEEMFGRCSVEPRLPVQLSLSGIDSVQLIREFTDILSYRDQFSPRLRNSRLAIVGFCQLATYRGSGISGVTKICRLENRSLKTLRCSKTPQSRLQTFDYITTTLDV